MDCSERQTDRIEYARLSLERSLIYTTRQQIILMLLNNHPYPDIDELVLAYLRESNHPGIDRPIMGDLPSVIELFRMLLPDWTITKLCEVNGLYRVVLSSSIGEYACRYVAKDITHPLLIAILTGRLLKLTNMIETWSSSA